MAMFGEYNPNRWFECTVDVLDATTRAEAFGFNSPGELLTAVADERRMHRQSLLKQVSAARFLKTHYQALLDSIGVDVGYSQVEYLAKIHGIDPDTANRIAPDVLRGERTMVDLRDTFEKLKRSNGRPASIAEAARVRVVEFEHRCYQMVLASPEVFGGRPGAEVIHNRSINGMGVDVVICDANDRVQVAIECKVSTARSLTLESQHAVARLYLLMRRAPVVWVLMPEAARPAAEAFRRTADRWDLPQIRVGLVQEGEQTRLVEEL